MKLKAMAVVSDGARAQIQPGGERGDGDSIKLLVKDLFLEWLE